MQGVATLSRGIRALHEGIRLRREDWRGWGGWFVLGGWEDYGTQMNTDSHGFFLIKVFLSRFNSIPIILIKSESFSWIWKRMRRLGVLRLGRGMLRLRCGLGYRLAQRI